MVGAHGYQRFLVSKPVVGQNIALHAVPAYRASSYLVGLIPLEVFVMTVSMASCGIQNIYAT